MYKNHPEGFLKYRLLGPTPRVSNSVGLRSGLRRCISNKFPGAADAAGSLGLHFENRYSRAGVSKLSPLGQIHPVACLL